MSSFEGTISGQTQRHQKNNNYNYKTLNKKNLTPWQKWIGVKDELKDSLQKNANNVARISVEGIIEI